ncbi:uncharacterized protein PV09_02914 [Verruconis gallopava]|uniref:Peptidase C45 hydrolase domain-containing protein n=1 Tax=Verruconis gallopava TaxID=253628 RepID=A0A0D1Z0J5_9PEZI|nr:uncharacterized protein PV09_02914 [Verruconis gallopava]KIW06477.1 hypothetical protein PV09_02914 [Verruconis gallopava]
MLQIRCEGSPYQIGTAHGRAAKEAIGRSIDFYERVFRERTGMGWASVEQVAMEYMPLVLRHRDIFEEVQGVAHGSGFNVGAIMAINARTEIMYGLMDEGCTTLAWKPAAGGSWLAQNWDWQVGQKENLVVLDVAPSGGRPRYKIVTEAGLIGKIGLNEAGVGVCFNAIQARGVDTDSMPAHVGLKLVMESRSREEAVKRLETLGIGSACTITIADPTGGVALECSARGIERIEMDDRGRVFHSNHFLKPQEGVFDTQMPADTLARLARIIELADDLEGEPTVDKIRDLFKDEQGFPASICRMNTSENVNATLFNIVMDLQKKEALVSVGRPVAPEGELWLRFD